AGAGRHARAGAAAAWGTRPGRQRLVDARSRPGTGAGFLPDARTAPGHRGPPGTVGPRDPLVGRTAQERVMCAPDNTVARVPVRPAAGPADVLVARPSRAGRRSPPVVRGASGGARRATGRCRPTAGRNRRAA